MSNHVNGVNGVNGTNGMKGGKPVFPEDAATKEYAALLDAADPLASFREKFIIPSKANIASKRLAKPSMCHTEPDVFTPFDKSLLQTFQKSLAFTSAVTRWVCSPRSPLST